MHSIHPISDIWSRRRRSWTFSTWTHCWSFRPRARRTAAQECAPIIFLDGAYLGNTRDVDVDVLPVDAMEAMETYAQVGSIPPEFNRSGAVCGVIALWTRR